MRGQCQIAVCSPSRNSFMTGRRPDKTLSWNFKNHFVRETPPLETPPSRELPATPCPCHSLPLH